MAEYLIAFNDEWVPEHTSEEIGRKAVAGRAVIQEMEAAGVFVFGNGALDASTVVCSVEAREGKPLFTDGPVRRDQGAPRRLHRGERGR